MTHIHVRGPEIWASCPSHKDSGDSWSINRNSGFHSCFACRYSGTLQMLIMDELDCDNFVATRLMTSYGSAELMETAAVRAQRDDVYDEDDEPYRRPPMSIPAQYASFVDVPDSKLAERFITRESADEFKVRWRRDTPGGSWVLPIRSPGNQLLGYQEKNDTEKEVKNRPMNMRKSNTVFGAERLTSWPRAIVVESPLDAVRLHSLGYDHVVATFGAEVSEDQMRLITGYADSVLLALDNDAAGRENMAAIASGKKYNRRGQETRGTSWLARVPLWIMDYAPGDLKDVGEMRPARVHSLVESPMAALPWLTNVERQNRVCRNASKVPGRGRQPDGRGAKPARRLRDGVGQIVLRD